MRALGLVWAVVVFAAVALAGCSDDAGESAEGGADAAATGGLRGLVIDAAIRPVAGAAVALAGAGGEEATVVTDDDGLWGFAELAPGAYIINVSKPGYLATQGTAQVEAGVHLPKLVTLTMELAGADAPYVWPLSWNGHVTCGTTFQNWCAAAHFASGTQVAEDGSFLFLFDEFMEKQRTPDFLQVEFFWEPVQPASSWAYAGFWASTWEEWQECLCTPNILSTVDGQGYILVQVDAAAMQEVDVGFSTGVGVGISPGSSDPEGTAATPGSYSVMVDQPFQAFFHVFYGCVPPEGWLFSEHGAPPCDPTTMRAPNA